jgi:hypothetical protein
MPESSQFDIMEGVEVNTGIVIRSEDDVSGVIDSGHIKATRQDEQDGQDGQDRQDDKDSEVQVAVLSPRKTRSGKVRL